MAEKPHSIPLLTTKLNVPPQRPRLVRRPRLVARLNAGLGCPFTLVSAPAGYGKTTLLLEWLAELPEGYDFAWLSLDEGDNDPHRFLSYILGAMQKIQAGFGKGIIPLLQSPQPPPMDLILTLLLNEMASLSRPFVLILDDYHFIRTPAIHKQLSFLLDHQPENLHLALASREDPLLPVPRLRARGQILEIRQGDLRFTGAEAAEFLKTVMGLSLSPAEISALEQRTEGWITGLQLVALSMRGRDDLSGFIQAFTGSSRFILDYLIEEVFEQQSSEVKDFLLETSILERLSGPLCEAVTGRAGCQDLLEALEGANLFIVALDQSRGWYRYHHLFAELLHHRLRVLRPEALPELQRRASLWFEAQGLAPEAIHYALAGKDWERAADLIQSASGDLLKGGEVLTVIAWYQSLPEEILCANPRLCFDYCWPLLLAGQFELARPLLERVEGMAGENPEFLGEVYAAQAYLARGQGEHAWMVSKSQQALALLPKSSWQSRGLVALNLGLAYWHMGQMQAAEEVWGEALEAAQATGNQYAALTALIFQGRIFAVRGQLHQAFAYFENAARQGGDIPVNALAYNDLASLHYEWNDLEASDRCLNEAIALCKRTQNHEFLVGSLMIQSRLRIAQGNWAGAEDALGQAWEWVRSGKIPTAAAERVAVAQARLSLAKGEPPGEFGDQLNDWMDCHPFYRFLGVTRALVLPPDQARPALEGLIQAAQANDWGYGWIAVRLLQAAMAETQEVGLGYLAEALQKAESEGYLRSFLEAGERLVPLLREAARRGITPEYAGRILAALAEAAPLAGGEAQALVEPLSERELEVLRLVIAGLSNREIAGQLVITPGTAKTHVHNLCGKLGARNRTEAAMKARELGLV